MTFKNMALKVALCTAAVSMGAKDMSIQIRVKLINEWSGKPYIGQAVTLIEANGQLGSGLPQQDVVEKVRSRTGPDGTARYLLKSPLPSRFLFDLGALRGCPSETPNQWQPQKIINSGVIVPASCVPQSWHGKFRWQDIKPQPGEIIFFVSPPARAQW